MSKQAAGLFPFVIAVLLPPAGLILGLAALQKPDRELGVRLIVVSLLAALVWVLLFVG
ncbi:MAG: hypothetical protein ACHQCI_04330 [Solirubrobacterales bacterium]|jgi:hypothetical protein